MFQGRLEHTIEVDCVGGRLGRAIGGAIGSEQGGTSSHSPSVDLSGWSLRSDGDRNQEAESLSMPRDVARIVQIGAEEDVRVTEVRIGRGRLERDRFLATHGVRQLGPHTVEVSLLNSAPIDFLLGVDALVGRVFGRNYLSANATRAWYQDPAWSVPLSTVIRVQGDLADLAWKNREAQEIAGAANVNLMELAVAHAAFYVMTVRSLFGGFRVRAEKGALVFGKDGLAPCLVADASRNRFISACRYSNHV